jgi:hypothetical protein
VTVSGDGCIASLSRLYEMTLDVSVKSAIYAYALPFATSLPTALPSSNRDEISDKNKKLIQQLNSRQKSWHVDR